MLQPPINNRMMLIVGMIVKLHQQYHKNTHDVSSIFSNHRDKEYISKERQWRTSS